MPQFNSWSEAFSALKDGIGGLFGPDMSIPGGFSVSYREKGKWKTVATYPKTAEGLARLNKELPRLVEKMRDADLAEEQRLQAIRAAEKAKLESYTPVEYANPRTGKIHTFHTADLSTAKPVVRRMANLAKKMGFDFYVVPKAEIEASGINYLL